MSLAGVLAEPEVHHGPTSQGDEGPQSRDREAQARLLIVDLRIGLLILRGVGHRHRRPVKQVDVPTLPQPTCVDVGFQGTPRLASHVGDKGFGQALAGLAVSAGFRRTGASSLPQPVGDQAGDRGAAGVVRTKDLSQEDPQCDQRRKDPVQPAGDGG